MPESSGHDSASAARIPVLDGSSAVRSRKGLWSFFTMLPVMIAILIYHLDSFDPAPLPVQVLAQGQGPLTAPLKNDHMLQGAEFVGVGQLSGPEDLAYDPKSRLIYTGCQDGWIKRVRINQSVGDSVVENWVRTEGRPLGLTFGQHNEVIVADSYLGLLNVSEDGAVELLTDAAEGLKFKLTDAVDVADDGRIYFTDASYKYSLHDYIWDILEGKPHGRLLCYDPKIRETKVLAKDLYFANGIALSPDQSYVIVCETPLKRCSKYHIQGKKIGQVEKFIDNLPGFPDNIRYDGEGHYWIALATGTSIAWDLTLRYPFIRKLVGMVERYIGSRPRMEKNGGVLAVDLEGKAVAHYYDSKLFLISSGIKIGNHLYCGSIHYPYIIRLDLTQHPAA